MGNYERVKGFEDCYLINRDGVIFSLLTNKILTPYNRTNGYKCIVLCKKGIGNKRIDIHRLVAIQFIENPENKLYVNHKNGVKSDNSVENLEWCTHSENMKHAIRTGLTPPPPTMTGKFGSAHNRSKTIYEFSAKGELLEVYGSGLEFQRKTGKSHSCPGWSMKYKKPIHGLYYSRTEQCEYLP